MPRVLKSLIETPLEEVLQKATGRALRFAADAASDVADGDEVDGPTSLRLTKRVVAFYDAFATELGISRNAAIHLVLEQMINTVEPH